MGLFPNWQISWLGSGIALSFFLFLNTMLYLNTKGLAATDGYELIGYPFPFYTHGGFGGQTYFLWKQLLIDSLIISSATLFAGHSFAQNRSFLKLVIFLVGILIAVRVAYILFPGF